mmetsp:Transcript_110646/g.292152  ORF Transcript_110646/g.292152 Transcript_110646/m.292152 type:complete len:288 (-) Transcript_110646:553-1416(-)
MPASCAAAASEMLAARCASAARRASMKRATSPSLMEEARSTMLDGATACKMPGVVDRDVTTKTSHGGASRARSQRSDAIVGCPGEGGAAPTSSRPSTTNASRRLGCSSVLQSRSSCPKALLASGSSVIRSTSAARASDLCLKAVMYGDVQKAAAALWTKSAARNVSGAPAMQKWCATTAMFRQSPLASGRLPRPPLTMLVMSVVLPVPAGPIRSTSWPCGGSLPMMMSARDSYTQKRGTMSASDRTRSMCSSNGRARHTRCRHERAISRPLLLNSASRWRISAASIV